MSNHQVINDQRIPIKIMTDEFDEKILIKVFNQISRDVPVGRSQHNDDRILDDAVRPFESGLKALKIMSKPYCRQKALFQS